MNFHVNWVPRNKGYTPATLYLASMITQSKWTTMKMINTCSKTMFCHFIGNYYIYFKQNLYNADVYLKLKVINNETSNLQVDY